MGQAFELVIRQTERQEFRRELKGFPFSPSNHFADAFERAAGKFPLRRLRFGRLGDDIARARNHVDYFIGLAVRIAFQQKPENMADRQPHNVRICAD
ncbi:MAG: hypothetical protein U1E20_00480 [Methylocystis sp.]|uniref:hypothetical protein n=1 Tax=Methylocystis sp. TaxID=1911079 RepID=UPI003930108C